VGWVNEEKSEHGHEGCRSSDETESIGVLALEGQ
jgi:hypothetical protein